MSSGPLRVVWLFCALASAGRAAAASYVVDVWDAGRGLPGNAATALAQTADGYLWIGSYNGLARFDGIRFVTSGRDFHSRSISDERRSQMAARGDAVSIIKLSGNQLSPGSLSPWSSSG